MCSLHGAWLANVPRAWLVQVCLYWRHGPRARGPVAGPRSCRCPLATGTPKQSEIEFGARGGTKFDFLNPTTHHTLRQLARLNNPKSTLVPEGTKFDFLNPTTHHTLWQTGTALWQLAPGTAVLPLAPGTAVLPLAPGTEVLPLAPGTEVLPLLLNLHGPGLCYFKNVSTQLARVERQSAPLDLWGTGQAARRPC